MTAALANLTQVVTHSPQVGALAGGHLAAEEAARKEAQVEASQRLRDVVTRTVSSLEETSVVTPVDSQARREHRRPKPAALKAGRGGPPPATGGRDQRGAEASPFDPQPVIDVRI